MKVLRYEIKNINPPRDVIQAHGKADARRAREARGDPELSEGERDAKINQAEGEKQRVIKESEANRQQQINEAQGEAAAILAVATATAEGLRRVAAALGRRAATRPCSCALPSSTSTSSASSPRRAIRWSCRRTSATWRDDRAGDQHREGRVRGRGPLAARPARTRRRRRPPRAPGQAAPRLVQVLAGPEHQRAQHQAADDVHHVVVAAVDGRCAEQREQGRHPPAVAREEPPDVPPGHHRGGDVAAREGGAQDRAVGVDVVHDVGEDPALDRDRAGAEVLRPPRREERVQGVAEQHHAAQVAREGADRGPAPVGGQAPVAHDHRQHQRRQGVVAEVGRLHQLVEPGPGPGPAPGQARLQAEDPLLPADQHRVEAVVEPVEDDAQVLHLGVEQRESERQVDLAQETHQGRARHAGQRRQEPHEEGRAEVPDQALVGPRHDVGPQQRIDAADHQVHHGPAVQLDAVQGQRLQSTAHGAILPAGRSPASRRNPAPGRARRRSPARRAVASRRRPSPAPRRRAGGRRPAAAASRRAPGRPAARPAAACRPTDACSGRGGPRRRSGRRPARACRGRRRPRRTRVRGLARPPAAAPPPRPRRGRPAATGRGRCPAARSSRVSPRGTVPGRPGRADRTAQAAAARRSAAASRPPAAAPRPASSGRSR